MGTPIDLIRASQILESSNALLEFLAVASARDKQLLFDVLKKNYVPHAHATQLAFYWVVAVDYATAVLVKHPQGVEEAKNHEELMKNFLLEYMDYLCAELSSQEGR